MQKKKNLTYFSKSLTSSSLYKHHLFEKNILTNSNFKSITSLLNMVQVCFSNVILKRSKYSDIIFQVIT